MKQLFYEMPQLSLKENQDYLLDTCFLVWIFNNHKEKQLTDFAKNNRVAITSFNAEEFLYILQHKLPEKIKISTRKYFHKQTNLSILITPIHPGNKKEEIDFVNTILPELNKEEHDPSDAVLLAAAIKTNANIITRDKHDIFNQHIKNFLNKSNIQIIKTFPK